MPVELVKTDTGYKVIHRTERVYVYGMPEALTLSPRDARAYLAGLEDPDEPGEPTSHELTEVLRKCQALELKK